MGRIIVLVTLFCSVFCLESTADTVDYYIIRYNGKIVPFKMNEMPILKLKKDKIDKLDSLSIAYIAGCTPCFECIAVAYIEPDLGGPEIAYAFSNVKESGGHRGFNQLPTIGLYSLTFSFQYSKVFNLFYYEVGFQAREKMLALKIILE